MMENGNITKLNRLVNDRAQTISMKDIKRIHEFLENVDTKKKDIPTNYIRLKYQLEFSSKIIDDFFLGKCNDIPFYSIMLLAVLLMYFLDTSDIIPDDTYGIGFLDDYTVGEIVFDLIEGDFDEYCQMKQIDISNCYD